METRGFLICRHPTWTPDSWRACPAAQQPDWPDAADLDRALKVAVHLCRPLVFAGEAREPHRPRWRRSPRGEAFLLQAGDCAESFDAFSADTIRDKLKVILQMAVVLTYSSGVPVVKVGRIAGQFAKPRSADTETIDGVELPSFRGHIVNDIAFTEPRPHARSRAAAHRLPPVGVHAEPRAGVHQGRLRRPEPGARVEPGVRRQLAPRASRYEQIADEIDRALRFMKACGIDTDAEPQLHNVDFYTSHEALILGYEEALTRQDSLTGDWYDCSAHMLWIGERTRQLDGAHVAVPRRRRATRSAARSARRPRPTRSLALCDALDPDRTPGPAHAHQPHGRRARRRRPAAAARGGHATAATRSCGRATRCTATPSPRRAAARPATSTRCSPRSPGFFAAHAAAGTWPGGVHVELTGDDVTECLGGAEEILDADLDTRYETMCDPRLNGRQSLDLAFRVAELLRSTSRVRLGRRSARRAAADARVDSSGTVDGRRATARLADGRRRSPGDVTSRRREC